MVVVNLPDVGVIRPEKANHVQSPPKFIHAPIRFVVSGRSTSNAVNELGVMFDELTVSR